MNLPLDENFIANYLTRIIKETGNNYESIAQKCNMSESTVKNICQRKTTNPGILNVAPVVYAANGSLDEMCGKTKEDIDEKTKNLIKEMSEFQFAEYKKTEEIRIENIRKDHEKHIADLKENHENQNKLKDQLYTEKVKENYLFKILTCIGFGILIGLLILEVSNPNLGWIKF